MAPLFRRLRRTAPPVPPHAIPPGHQVLVVDYPVVPRVRPTFHPHPGVRAVLDRRRDHYRAVLAAVVDLRDDLDRIPTHPADAESPAWLNGWLPALDGAALYAFLARGNPRTYVEVGSGNSTKFARRAIRDHRLRTTILSIDPSPRAEVDGLCDEVVRRPLEDCDLDLFEGLEAEDVVFVDGSHRVFTNADSTVALLEVLPMLAPGVLVQVHDVYLPFDYPEVWNDRWYAEQYLLAAWLLADGPHIEVELPGHFVCTDEELSANLAPLWAMRSLRHAEHWGHSFWMRKA